MGKGAAETVKEIEATRTRLGDEISELEERLPRPARIGKRVLGAALGAGVGGTVLWAVVRRRRKSRKLGKQASKVLGKVGGAVPVATVVQVVPDRWAEKVEDALQDGRWKGVAAGAAGLWVAIRMAELRQMRRLNRALIGAR